MPGRSGKQNDVNYLAGTLAQLQKRPIAAHQLDGAKHTVAGLTPGHFLKATGVNTFGFAAHGLTYSDVGAAAAGHNHASVYEPVITAGTSAQYWRGDKTWQTLNQAAVVGMTTSDSPTLTGLTLSGLTASLPVVTDGSKGLASLAYATFKSNLSLTQNDITNLTTTSAPTFAGSTNNGAVLIKSGNYLTLYKTDNTNWGSMNFQAVSGVDKFYFGDNVYIALDCSALSFTDRTPFPASRKIAKDAILSHVGKDGKLDHAKLHEYVKVKDGRNLSATVSALVETIKDLYEQNDALVARVKNLEPVH